MRQESSILFWKIHLDNTVNVEREREREREREEEQEEQEEEEEPPGSGDKQKNCGPGTLTTARTTGAPPRGPPNLGQRRKTAKTCAVLATEEKPKGTDTATAWRLGQGT
ncbi:unnamed protein product [Prorocentrum cordatum]|uniref:Uncharacterized protein n=1 Tax=Prorocentrum cordatum TaxID=2364126 RepID=A0ABN9UGJ4_9DINO|nr:unnamed protein product [Polarella glacialis]